MENIQNLITGLSDAFGPSGMEDDVAALVRQAAASVGSTWQDTIKNVYITPNDPKEPLVLLDAHMDEVGFMIESISEQGQLYFQPLGGWNPFNVCGGMFEIRTAGKKKIPAVAASLPVHFSSETKTPDFTNMTLDTGCTSRQEVLDLGIAPGDFVVPAVKSLYDPGRDLYMGKAFDDRIGVAALLETLRRLQQRDALAHVRAVCTAQEEVGERGMQAALPHLKARVALCFEGAPADDAFANAHPAQTSLNQGVMVRAKDRSMITHPAWLAFCKKTAARHGIPLQIAVRSGGGTNGGLLHTHNIPTLVLGIPTRHAHGMVGFCSGADFENAVQLAVEIICELEKEDFDWNQAFDGLYMDQED